MVGHVCLTPQASCSGRSHRPPVGWAPVIPAARGGGGPAGRWKLYAPVRAPQPRQLLGVVQAEETGAPSTGGGSSSIDTERAVKLAAQRLENLLSGTGDGESELMNNIIREMAPETKTAGFCTATGIAGSVAAAGCFFLNIDGLGGMDLSTSTVVAGGIGAFFGLPLIALRRAKWSEGMMNRFPQLATIQEQQVESETPLYEGLSDLQLAVVATVTALTSCVWELSLIQGGVEQLYLDLGAVFEWSQPQVPAMLLALLVASVTSGLSSGLTVQEDPEELQVVQTALENCDRYYNVMDGNKTNAAEMALAFKAIVYVWLREKRKAQWLAFWIDASEIVYVTILWRLTGNLAAPVIAIALGNGADMVGVLQRSKLKLKRGK